MAKNAQLRFVLFGLLLCFQPFARVCSIAPPAAATSFADAKNDVIDKSEESGPVRWVKLPRKRPTIETDVGPIGGVSRDGGTVQLDAVFDAPPDVDLEDDSLNDRTTETSHEVGEEYKGAWQDDAEVDDEQEGIDEEDATHIDEFIATSIAAAGWWPGNSLASIFWRKLREFRERDEFRVHSDPEAHRAATCFKMADRLPINKTAIMEYTEEFRGGRWFYCPATGRMVQLNYLALNPPDPFDIQGFIDQFPNHYWSKAYAERFEDDFEENFEEDFEEDFEDGMMAKAVNFVKSSIRERGGMMRKALLPRWRWTSPNEVPLTNISEVGAGLSDPTREIFVADAVKERKYWQLGWTSPNEVPLTNISEVGAGLLDLTGEMVVADAVKERKYGQLVLYLAAEDSIPAAAEVRLAREVAAREVDQEAFLARVATLLDNDERLAVQRDVTRQVQLLLGWVEERDEQNLTHPCLFSSSSGEAEWCDILHPEADVQLSLVPIATLHRMWSPFGKFLHFEGATSNDSGPSISRVTGFERLDVSGGRGTSLSCVNETVITFRETAIVDDIFGAGFERLGVTGGRGTALSHANETFTIFRETVIGDTFDNDTEVDVDDDGSFSGSVDDDGELLVRDAPKVPPLEPEAPVWCRVFGVGCRTFSSSEQSTSSVTTTTTETIEEDSRRTVTRTTTTTTTTTTITTTTTSADIRLLKRSQ